jgi:hypothetical protein
VFVPIVLAVVPALSRPVARVRVGAAMGFVLIYPRLTHVDFQLVRGVVYEFVEIRLVSEKIKVFSITKFLEA